MVQIAGKYKLVKTESFSIYVSSLDARLELAEGGVESEVTLDVIVDGNRYTFNISNSSSGLTNLSFELDKEFDEPMPLGITLKSIVKKEGDNKLVVSSTTGNGFGTRTYIFSDSGLIVELAAAELVAKHTFERI